MNKKKKISCTNQIRIDVNLNEEKIPTKITWDADNIKKRGKQEAAAIILALWDKANKDLINFDLWINEMPLHDMKMFQINLLSALAENMRKSTGDEFMADETQKLAKKFFHYHQNKMNKSIQ